MLVKRCQARTGRIFEINYVISAMPMSCVMLCGGIMYAANHVSYVDQWVGSAVTFAHWKVNMCERFVFKARESILSMNMHNFAVSYCVWPGLASLDFQLTRLAHPWQIPGQTGH